MEGGGSRANPLNSIASVYFFCLVLSLFLFQSVIFSVFTPLPQIFCYLRLGRWAGLSMPFLIFIIAGFAGSGAGLGYLLQFAIPGVVLSESILKRFSVEKSCFLALGATVAAIMIFLSLYASAKGLGVAEAVKTAVQNAANEAIVFHEKTGNSQEHIREFKELASFIVETVPGIYHSLVVIIIMFMLWVNILGLSQVMKRVGASPPFGDLSHWRSPEYLVWGVIAGGISLFAGIDFLKVPAVSLLLVLFWIYFFQGMAIVSFFFKKKEVPGFLKGIGYFFIVSNLAVLVVALGLFDLWFDFRRLGHPMKPGQA